MAAPEIIKTGTEALPALRLIGRRYTEADAADGGYAPVWGEWFAQGWFAPLEGLDVEGVEAGYIGLARCNGTPEEFAYWIGAFAAPTTAVPDGYEALDLPAATVGVCWIRGSDDDGAIYRMHDQCVAALEAGGFGSPARDASNAVTSFERYNCPRFTDPDAEGRVILDYGIVLA